MRNPRNSSRTKLSFVSTGFPQDTALSPELDEIHLAKILTYLNEHLVFESIRRPSTEMTPLLKNARGPVCGQRIAGSQL